MQRGLLQVWMSSLNSMMQAGHAQPDLCNTYPGSSVTDAYLLAQAQTGNLAAFEELAARHAAKVFALILRMVHGRREVAEDLAQETFLSAFKSLAQFRGDSHFSTWLHRIAVNKTLHFLEKKQPPTSGESGALELPDPEGNPQQLLETSELRDVLMRSINKLPDSLRLVFVMRELQRLGYDEIAAALDSTPEAVRVRLHRAKKELLQKLRPYLQGDAPGRTTRAQVGSPYATS